MPGAAETTAAIALMVGIAVMMCPSTMKSAIVSAWKRQEADGDPHRRPPVEDDGYYHVQAW
jgi:hypothetical protein